MINLRNFSSNFQHYSEATSTSFQSLKSLIINPLFLTKWNLFSFSGIFTRSSMCKTIKLRQLGRQGGGLSSFSLFPPSPYLEVLEGSSEQLVIWQYKFISKSCRVWKFWPSLERLLISEYPIFKTMRCHTPPIIFMWLIFSLVPCYWPTLIHLINNFLLLALCLCFHVTYLYITSHTIMNG